MNQSGYTVIELITLLAIVGVLSAITIANTRVGGVRQQIRDSAALYLTAVKRAEVMAASSTPVNDSAESNPELRSKSRKAYGVCITSSQQGTDPAVNKCAKASGAQPLNMFQVYARKTTDTNYTQRPASPDIIESRSLPRNIVFVSDQYYLDYFPPQPSLRVNGDSAVNQAQIDIKTTSGDTYQKAIIVRPLAGAVYVQ